MSAAGAGSPVSGLLLGPLQHLLDRGVARSTSAAALCEQLEGRSLQLHAGSDVLAAFFTVTRGRLELQAGINSDADARLSGSLLAMLALAGSAPDAAIRNGGIRLSGDPDVAANFQALLGFVRPDPEEELATITGDSVAHTVGESARALSGWARHAGRSLSRSAAEYLNEESRLLVPPAELEVFLTEVDTLSAAVDRLEARLRLLQSQLISD